MPPKTNRAGTNTVNPKDVPCPAGSYPDGKGGCWNFKIVATLVRGGPCQESYQIPFKGDPGPLEQEMLRVFLKSPQYQETLKRMKEMGKSGPE